MCPHMPYKSTGFCAELPFSSFTQSTVTYKPCDGTLDLGHQEGDVRGIHCMYAAASGVFLESA